MATVNGCLPHQGCNSQKIIHNNWLTQGVTPKKTDKVMVVWETTVLAPLLPKTALTLFFCTIPYDYDPCNPYFRISRVFSQFAHAKLGITSSMMSYSHYDPIWIKRRPKNHSHIAPSLNIRWSLSDSHLRSSFALEPGRCKSLSATLFNSPDSIFSIAFCKSSSLKILFSKYGRESCKQ